MGETAGCDGDQTDTQTNRQTHGVHSPAVTCGPTSLGVDMARLSARRTLDGKVAFLGRGTHNSVGPSFWRIISWLGTLRYLTETLSPMLALEASCGERPYIKWCGCHLLASSAQGLGLAGKTAFQSYCLSCYHLASPGLRDLLLMNLPCFSGADKLFPFIKLSWLNLALGNGLSFPPPPCCAGIASSPKNSPCL